MATGSIVRSNAFRIRKKDCLAIGRGAPRCSLANWPIHFATVSSIDETTATFGLMCPPNWLSALQTHISRCKSNWFRLRIFFSLTRYHFDLINTSWTTGLIEHRYRGKYVSGMRSKITKVYQTCDHWKIIYISLVFSIIIKFI